MSALAIRSANLRASVFMMLAMMGYTVNDMLVKTLADDLRTPQIIALRGAILSVLIGLLIWRHGLLSRLGEALSPLVIARTLLELGATLTYLAALMRLPLADASAILQALPLAVALGAALFFGERIGWRRWLAIAVGFAGVMLIIRPGLQSFEPLSLLVLLSVVFAAGRDLCTRALPPSVPSLLVSGVSAVLISLSGALIATVGAGWRPVGPAEWGVLFAAALFLLVGYQCIVLAMRVGDIAYVVPFRYTSLLWAILLGLIVFGHVPDALTLLGSAVVVATGLFTVYREVRLGRRATTAPPVVSNPAASAPERRA